MRQELGRYGVFSHRSRLTPEVAAEVEQLGYGALWIGGSPSGDLALPQRLLQATTHLVVATGIVNIWKDDAHTVAASYRRVEAAHPGRFLLGIGAGHPEAIQDYTRPYAALVAYLDVLDAEGVPVGGRVLAALGPQVLALSAHRSAGAHPYLVTPEHTRRARTILGSDALLAPEQHVVLDTDVSRARTIVRRVIEPYLRLSNYTNNFRRLGFADADLAGAGSDRFVDAVAAWGEPATVAARINGHLDAGADHVAVQVLAGPRDDHIEPLRRLAAELGPAS